MGPYESRHGARHVSERFVYRCNGRLTLYWRTRHVLSPLRVLSPQCAQVCVSLNKRKSIRLENLLVEHSVKVPSQSPSRRLAHGPQAVFGVIPLCACSVDFSLFVPLFCLDFVVLDKFGCGIRGASTRLLDAISHGVVSCQRKQIRSPF